jgi:hypothetical protein
MDCVFLNDTHVISCQVPIQALVDTFDIFDSVVSLELCHSLDGLTVSYSTISALGAIENDWSFAKLPSTETLSRRMDIIVTLRSSSHYLCAVSSNIFPGSLIDDPFLVALIAFWCWYRDQHTEVKNELRSPSRLQLLSKTTVLSNGSSSQIWASFRSRRCGEP